MKLIVDEQCTGHGRCYSLMPQLLGCDDEGYVTIRGGAAIDIPAGSEELADEVVGSCPEQAIRLIDA